MTHARVLNLARERVMLTGMETKQSHDPALEDAPKSYAIVVAGTNGEMDPDLAAAMEEVHQAYLGNPDNFYNNPGRHREALEGLGRLLAEWQEENGAFTDEELKAARLSLYGK
jgi:hypothetical protein